MAELVGDSAPEGFDFQARFWTVGIQLHSCHQVGLLGDVLVQADALQALHRDQQDAIRAAHHLQDAPHCADRAHALGLGLLLVGVDLRRQGDEPVAPHGIVDQPHGALLAHGQPLAHEGIDDDVAQGQHGQHVGDGELRLLRDVFCLYVKRHCSSSISDQPSVFAPGCAGTAGCWLLIADGSMRPVAFGSTTVSMPLS